MANVSINSEVMDKMLALAESSLGKRSPASVGVSTAAPAAGIQAPEQP